MDRLRITGGAKLNGSVAVSCSKNAYLPIIAGVLLSDQPITLKGLPALRDIKTMQRLLGNLGVKISSCPAGVKFCADQITSLEAKYDLVSTMRASILVLGPLLTRFKKAVVSLPGGCAIGVRPIDLHLKYLEKMGAKIKICAGHVEASTSQLIGTKLVLPFPSVGATENLMMAAVLAEGTTEIENAALEPEIKDLANFLITLGAKIHGAGSPVISIEGVPKLGGGEYRAIGDRIEAATYIIAGIITKSKVTVTGFNPQHLDAVLNTLTDMGAQLTVGRDFVTVGPSDQLTGVCIDTAPYPGFPTDVQAQLVALATTANSSSMISERIFENRFMHLPELGRMGASFSLKGKTAMIIGSDDLNGAPVMCTDLRASAALVLAALVAKGESEILRVYHLDRGYDNLDGKLKSLGVSLERVNS
ncbi:MAG: UDP-N-acetylglucosamine 1-carboxyvinyltransferase [Bdellovibrionales bacterium]|nr:UDP-N-acetylglucosamine 1-carboxyvinyltransferase [Bdellovibrionales bacterium]MBT3525833.1 UDP-N-acetylglucosamine 1-carboxyvinyltransferase [Bdellovibrionales bacterium]